MVGKNKMLSRQNLGGGEPPRFLRPHTMFCIGFKTLAGWLANCLGGWLAGCLWLLGCLAARLAADPCSVGRLPILLWGFYTSRNRAGGRGQNIFSDIFSQWYGIPFQ